MRTRVGIKSCVFIKIKWTDIVSQVSQEFLFTYEYRDSYVHPTTISNCNKISNPNKLSQ